MDLDRSYGRIDCPIRFSIGPFDEPWSLSYPTAGNESARTLGM